MVHQLFKPKIRLICMRQDPPTGCTNVHASFIITLKRMTYIRLSELIRIGESKQIIIIQIVRSVSFTDLLPLLGLTK